MNPNKALWEKGDFTRLAQRMRRSGESLVNGLGITKGLKVLDLGCGDGTTALPEATLGAEVLDGGIGEWPRSSRSVTYSRRTPSTKSIDRTCRY